MQVVPVPSTDVSRQRVRGAIYREATAADAVGAAADGSAQVRNVASQVAVQVIEP